MTITKFCEFYYSSKMYGQEPFNSISSSIFCFFAFLFIYKNNNITNLQYILTSILFTCGIGSILFHYTLDNYWRIIDEIPMLWMVSISNIYFSPFNKYIKYCSSICIYVILLISTITNIQNENILIFRINFIVSIIFLCYFLRNKLSKNTFVIGAIGSSCWVIDIMLCNKFIYYLGLHTIWHFCMGYFSYNILHLFGNNNKKLT
jgi:hypothetical protein